MPRHNIQFGGLRSTPSEVTGRDGDLAECINLTSGDGEVRTVDMPQRVEHGGTQLKFPGQHLIGVHNGSFGKHYITIDDATRKTLRFYQTSGNAISFTNNNYLYTFSSEITAAECIGATVVISTGEGMFYFLWKKNMYKILGQTPELPEIQFFLDISDDVFIYDTNITVKDTDGEEHYGVLMRPDRNVHPYATTFNKRAYMQKTGDISSSGFSISTKDQLKAINDHAKYGAAAIIKESKKKGCFIFPFQLRYSIRYKDGSHSKHSQPMLMLPSTDKCPIAGLFFDYYDNVVGGVHDTLDGNGNAICNMFLYSLYGYKLKMFVRTANIFNDWEDVIEGIDIALSSQFYNYDESKLDGKYKGSDGSESDYFYWDDTNTTFNIDNNVGRLGERFLCNNKKYVIEDWRRGFSFPMDGLNYVEAVFRLPATDIQKLEKEISDNGVFHIVKNYTIAELKDMAYMNQTVDLTGSQLENLETLPILEDEYNTHHFLSAVYLKNYNERIIAAKIKECFFNGYKPGILQGFYGDSTNNPITNNNYKIKIYFIIETDNADVIVSNQDALYGKDVCIPYLYYPDVRCKKAVIEIEAYQERPVLYEVPMTRHQILNGAYYFNGFNSLIDNLPSFTTPPGTPLSSYSTNVWSESPSVIYQSLVANPFVFPVTNARQIGSRKITGLAINTQGMNAADFGTRPVFIFTEDGLWAMGVDGEGEFTSPAPISTQTSKPAAQIGQYSSVMAKQGLFFLADEGLMYVNGSQVTCVSNMLEGRVFNARTDLLPVGSVLPPYTSDYAVLNLLVGHMADGTSFRSYINAGAYLCYDGGHDRIFVINPSVKYFYSYNIRYGVWNRMCVMDNFELLKVENSPKSAASLPAFPGMRFTSAFQNFTETYMQDSGGGLWEIGAVLDQNRRGVKSYEKYGFLASRPIRFGTDDYKSISRILHRTDILQDAGQQPVTPYGPQRGGIGDVTSLMLYGTPEGAVMRIPLRLNVKVSDGGRSMVIPDNRFVRMMLYGTRDGNTFVRLNGLRGPAYRAYIVVLFMRLNPNDRYSYLTADFETRFTGKIR